MKKKNGFTMTELMFSIVIIAIVMAFLINLLVDINYEKTNELYDTANNYNRAEILKKVEGDFAISQLEGAYINGSNIVLSNSNGNHTLSISKSEDSEYIKYEGSKWKLETNNSETHISDKLLCQYSKKENGSDKYYLITINVPIIVDYSKDPVYDNTNGKWIYKDSKMDDITLTFYSTNFTGGSGCEVIS